MTPGGVARSVRIIRILWVVGFFVGTTTPVVDLVIGGPDVYAGFPDVVRLFWVSLTLLDPLAIILIALRLRASVVLAIAIMAADIAVNSAMVATHGLPVPGLINQLAFGLLVLATAPLLWKHARPARPRPANPGRP